MAKASVSVLVSSLTALAERIERVVQRTREDYETTTDFLEFLVYRKDPEKSILKLLDVMVAYIECMKSVGVKTKVEVEQLWTKHYSEPGVKTAVESLLQAEKHFTELTTEMESKLSPQEVKSVTGDPPKAGETFSIDSTLIAIPSSQQTTLEAYWKEAKYTLFVLLRLFG